MSNEAGFVCLFAMSSLKDYTEDLLVVFLGKLLEKKETLIFIKYKCKKVGIFFLDCTELLDCQF